MSTPAIAVIAMNFIKLLSPYRYPIFLAIIILASTFVRFTYISQHYVLVGDEGQYLDVAQSIAKGNGYRKEVLDTQRSSEFVVATEIMPLYTSLVALTHKIHGIDDRNAYYVNLVLSAALILVSFFLTLKLCASRQAALFAALLIAFDPVLTKMTALATKDILFCLMSLLVGLVLLYKQKKWFYPIIIISFSLLILSRRNGYWFILPLFVFFLAADPGMTIRKKLVAFSAVFCTVALLVSPWYLLVQEQGSNEFSAIISFAKTSENIDGTTGGGITALLRGWKTQVQSSLFSIVTSSSLVMQIILFVPLFFIRRRPSAVEWYWLSALAVFLALLSTHTLFDTTPDFYYLPFFAILLVYGTCGICSTIDMMIPNSNSRRLMLTLLALFMLFPLSEDLRNHIHPGLRKKYDESEKYSDLRKTIAWLNAYTNKGEIIVSSSAIRQMLRDIDNRMIRLPDTKEQLAPRYFKKFMASWLVIGDNNLIQKDKVNGRDYLLEWWTIQNDSLLETKQLPFLIEKYRTKYQIIYHIVECDVGIVK